MERIGSGRTVFGVLALLVSLSLVTSLQAQKEPDERLALTVDAPDLPLRTGNEFEASVLLSSSADGVDAWQFGVEHDPLLLELLEAGAGLTARTANNGQPAEFLVVDPEPANGAGATMGVVLSLADPSVSLPAGDDYELLNLRYRVLADPEAADPCEPIDMTIGFSETLGVTPVRPRVSTAGESFLPVLTGATVTARCSGSLEITQCEGGTDSVSLQWEFSEEPAWDFLFLYRDGELVEMLDPGATMYEDTNVAPGDHQYTVLTFIVEVIGEPTFIFSQCTATVNPVTLADVNPPTGSWIGGDTLTVTGTAFTVPQELSFALVGSEGESTEGLFLPFGAANVASDTELTLATPESPRLGIFDLRVETEFGDVVLPRAFEFGFVRGEVNSDGVLDMADAIALFEYLFIGGVDEPLCLDSADANDDGQLDIGDAVLVLWFEFLGGVAPAAPFPAAGQDPTTDDPFGCIE